jgi:antirestriction protein ArdC
VLREDNRAIVRAASQASKAADFLLQFLPRDEASVSDAETDELSGRRPTKAGV